MPTARPPTPPASTAIQGTSASRASSFARANPSSPTVPVTTPRVALPSAGRPPRATDVDGHLLGVDDAHVLQLRLGAGERRLRGDADVLAPLADVVQQLLVFRCDQQADRHLVEAVAVTAGGVQRREHGVEVVLGVGADLLRERVPDPRQRGRPEVELLGGVPRVVVRADRRRDELLVVGREPGDRVAGGHERDHPLAGDQQRVLRRLLGHPQREDPGVQEVGCVAGDDEVVHHVLERPFVGQHPDRRQVAVVAGRDRHERFDRVLGGVDDGQLARVRPEHVVQYILDVGVE